MTNFYNENFDFLHLHKEKKIGFLHFVKSRKNFHQAKFFLEKFCILVEKIIRVFATGENFHNIFRTLVKESEVNLLNWENFH